MFLGFSLGIIAYITVKDPNLPNSIVNIINTLPRDDKYGVKFLLSPTVPNAENVSYIISKRSEFFSVIVKQNDINTIQKNDTVRITNTLLRVSFFIFLLNTEISLFPFISAIIAMNTAAIVVVLIPPAIPPGDPPINISTIFINEPAFVSAD